MGGRRESSGGHDVWEAEANTDAEAEAEAERDAVSETGGKEAGRAGRAGVRGKHEMLEAETGAGSIIGINSGKDS